MRTTSKRRATSKLKVPYENEDHLKKWGPPQKMKTTLKNEDNHKRWRQPQKWWRPQKMKMTSKNEDDKTTLKSENDLKNEDNV